jgi:hypothetical protein
MPGSRGFFAVAFNAREPIAGDFDAHIHVATRLELGELIESVGTMRSVSVDRFFDRFVGDHFLKGEGD